MSDDLVKRARGWDFCWPSRDIQMLVPAMADRIEELEAKLIAVTAARELMGNMWANAQDKLGKALEALETIAYESVDDEGIYTARTALAELKGETK
jgi:hypothetical protein